MTTEKAGLQRQAVMRYRNTTKQVDRFQHSYIVDPHTPGPYSVEYQDVIRPAKQKIVLPHISKFRKKNKTNKIQPEF